MSYYTQVHGIVCVDTMGRTNSECRYIIETILEHLPIVVGADNDMGWYLNQEPGHNVYSNRDEYGRRSINRCQKGDLDYHERGRKVQTQFVITISSSLRNMYFDETFRDFWKWIYRLGKRVWITYCDVLVKGWDDKTKKDKEYRFRTADGLGDYFSDILEHTDMYGISWSKHLRWDSVSGYGMPRQLLAKYTNDYENDKRVGYYLNLPIVENGSYPDRE